MILNLGNGCGPRNFELVAVLQWEKCGRQGKEHIINEDVMINIHFVH